MEIQFCLTRLVRFVFGMLNPDRTRIYPGSPPPGTTSEILNFHLMAVSLPLEVALLEKLESYEFIKFKTKNF